MQLSEFQGKTWLEFVKKYKKWLEKSRRTDNLNHEMEKSQIDAISKMIVSFVLQSTGAIKVLFVTNWESYVSKSMPMAPLISKTIVWTVPVAEICLGLLLAVAPNNSTVRRSINVLLSSFLAIHGFSIAASQQDTCSCFGPFLKLNHHVMLAICVLLIVLNNVGQGQLTRLRDWYLKESLIGRICLHVSVLFFLTVLALVGVKDGRSKKPKLIQLGHSVSMKRALKQAVTVTFSERTQFSQTRGEEIFIFVDSKCPFSQKLLSSLNHLSSTTRSLVQIINHPVLNSGQARATDVQGIFLYISKLHPSLNHANGPYHEFVSITGGSVPTILLTRGDRVFKVESSGEVNSLDAIEAMLHQKSEGEI